MPSVTPLQIEPLVRALRPVLAQAGVWSRLLHDKRLSLLLAQHALSVVVSPVAEAPDTERYMVELSDGNATLHVEIGHCEHPALAMVTGAPASEGMQRLAGQALFAEPLRLLHQLGLGQWTPVGLVRSEKHPAAERSAPMSPWVALHREGRCLCLLRVGGEAVTLRHALTELMHAQRVRDERIANWVIPVRMVLHQHAYAVALLSTLVIGDVLLMQPIPSGKTGLPVLVQWGAATGRCFEVKASLRGSQMQVEASPTMSVDENLQDDPGSDTAISEALGELSLPVRFEIETVSMTLSDLSAIGPGYVIELTSPVATATIRLVACGQVVGHAELVAVGGQLGARITHMVER
jgi:type III secretion protein Q